MSTMLPPDGAGCNHRILSGSNDWMGWLPASLMGPPWPFVGEPSWLRACDDAPLRVPLRNVKRRLKVCVCVKHWKLSSSVQAPQTLHSALVRLYSTFKTHHHLVSFKEIFSITNNISSFYHFIRRINIYITVWVYTWIEIKNKII